MMPSCSQTGVPIHFHSSTTSGSASLMSLRIRASVLPRQSPRLAILSSIIWGANSPFPAAFFAMVTLLIGLAGKLAGLRGTALLYSPGKLAHHARVRVAIDAGHEDRPVARLWLPERPRVDIVVGLQIRDFLRLAVVELDLREHGFHGDRLGIAGVSPGVAHEGRPAGRRRRGDLLRGDRLRALELEGVRRDRHEQSENGEPNLSLPRRAGSSRCPRARACERTGARSKSAS